MTTSIDVAKRTVRSADPATAHVSGTPPDTAAPAAVAVDLGSGYTRIWASGRPMLHAPTITDNLSNPARLVRRGRISDPAGYEDLLSRLLLRYPQRLPAGALVVACRPVLATPDDENTARQVLAAVFHPSRVLFIDTVRAAAIGAGAASGPLVVADVGAQLTEVAVLADGAIAAARRAEVGMSDLIRPTSPQTIADAIVELVSVLRRHPDGKDLASEALPRGLLLVGGGATQPMITAHAAGALGVAVRSAARPRVAAVRGAALAALSALRRTAATRPT